jgi:ATP-dependent DNA helicase RecG
MLYYFPRRYDDYTQLKPINRLKYGEEVTVIGTVQNVINRPIRGHAQIVEAVVSDGRSVACDLVQPTWLTRRLRKEHIALAGKTDQYLGLVMNSRMGAMNSSSWQQTALPGLPADSQRTSAGCAAQ